VREWLLVCLEELVSAAKDGEFYAAECSATHAVRDAGGLASRGAGASSAMESTSVEEWLRPMLSAAAYHQSQPTERCSSHARRDTSLTTPKLSAEFSSSRDAQFQMEAPTPGNNE